MIQRHIVLGGDRVIQQKNKSIAAVTVVLYALILIFILFFKSMQPDNYKWILEHYRETHYLTPALSDRLFVALHPWRSATVAERCLNQNAYLNVLAFVPLGIFWSFLCEKRVLLSATTASLGLSLLIEIAQLFTMIGNYGIGDVICNTLGGFLGALLFLVVCQNSFFRKHEKKILIVMICISCVALSVLVYNTAIHLDVYMDILFRRI